MASIPISPDPKAPSTGSTQDDFPGVIGPDFRTSVPWWPPMENDARGKPDVVVMVLDDVGFAGLGCYGAEIDTPTIDALAEGGVRFNDFNVHLPLFAPGLPLTGRNHHRASGWLTCRTVTPAFPVNGAESRVGGHHGRSPQKKRVTAPGDRNARPPGAARGHHRGGTYPVALGRGFVRTTVPGRLGPITLSDVVETNQPSTHRHPEDGCHFTEDLNRSRHRVL